MMKSSIAEHLQWQNNACHKLKVTDTVESVYTVHRNFKKIVSVD